MNFESLLLQASSEMLMLLDVQSLHIVAASSSTHKQLGYDVPELIGKPIGDLECALSDLFFWEEMATSNKLLEAQGSYQRRDGSVFEIRKFVQRVGEHQEFYLVRARPARREHIDPGINITGLHLTATLEATDDGILLTDNGGAILNMNHRFSHLMALPEQLLAERDDHGIASYIENILLRSPGTSDSPTALSQTIDLKLDLGGDTFEKLFLADGRVIECVSHPARDRDRTLGRVFCYRDITQRVQHEQYLQEARDIAEQATLSKGQFLANMSHEIRTPMNAILGMLKLMHATDLNERQFDYVSKAEGAAQSMLGLLNDILDFSKIEAGKLELDPQAFSPERVLRELSVILSANLGNKPVELLFDIDPKLPKSMIGDSMRLQQVLINLGGNALKFTQSGEVVVHLHVLEQLPGATRLRIGVRDSGIGIAPENQARIFSDFSQAEASTTRRYGGTGLGLSICKRLVGLMHGELGVTSALGQGSDFHFDITLPLADTLDGAAPAEQAPETLDALVVDDNATARDIMASMMRSLGWKTEVAATGQEAIDKVRARANRQQAPYQAIFVDWEMPGMDGWETLSRLRQLGAPFGAPICVMLTAHGRQAFGQRATQDQIALNAYLVKPVTSAMLREVVSDVRAGGSAFRKQERVAGKSAPRLQGMRLLVVEDNLINQQVARELLVAEGAEVQLADNGLVAVSALTQARNGQGFDAVLMDVQMPVMDGFTATRVIRKDLGLDQIPIIAMTANAMASDRDECLNAGMNDHIGKPFDLTQLVQLLLRSTGFKPLEASADPVDELPTLQAGATGGTLHAKPDIMDVDKALSQLGGLTDLYLELATQFEEDLRNVVPEYRRALTAARLPDAERQMHTLKGTAATLGAMALSRLAADLEAVCRDATRPDSALAREAELAELVNASMAALRLATRKLV
jgi:signal transduction histidine kinase/CheY-like chemotaxis protein/HPt (histidine-containing phosphotransfer) domain-containing protein